MEKDSIEVLHKPDSREKKIVIAKTLFENYLIYGFGKLCLFLPNFFIIDLIFPEKTFEFITNLNLFELNTLSGRVVFISLTVKNKKT